MQLNDTLVSQEITPRRWQQAALNAWKGDLRGIVSVVTGGGKSILAVMAISEFLRRFRDGTVTVLVPTTALLDQWTVLLQDGLRLPNEDVVMYSGSVRPARPGRVNVCVLNTARTLAPSLGGNGDRMLIVDECHRAASPANAQALKGPYKASLGLSATPEREADDLTQTTLIPLLGSIVYEYTYEDARADNVISHFDLNYVKAPENSEIPEAEDGLVYRATTGRRSTMHSHLSERRADSLKPAISGTKFRNFGSIAVAARIASDHKGHRILIFHEQVQAAEAIYRILQRHGASIAIYHSGLSRPLRHENLRQFRAKQADIIVACRALDEGVDVPDADIAIIAAATRSRRQRIQRLGRVLRPAPGKERAIVFTIYSSDEERQALAGEASKYADISKIRWYESKVLRPG